MGMEPLEPPRRDATHCQWFDARLDAPPRRLEWAPCAHCIADCGVEGRAPMRSNRLGAAADNGTSADSLPLCAAEPSE